MITLFRALSWWPLWLLHSLGWVLGWLVFLLSGEYRKRFLANARLAEQGARQWLAAVGQAGMLVAELPRLWMGRPVQVRWDGVQHVEAALAQGRGIVFLTPHLGSFEITAQAYAQRFGAAQPVTVLYRPARHAWVRRLVGGARQRAGLATAPTNLAGVKQLLKTLRAGHSVGLLPDQVPPQGQGVWASFFGRPAYTMTLSARLVQQTGAAVVLIWGERLSWGRGFCIHARDLQQPLPQDTAQAAEAINAAMEGMIRECPGQYLWGYARYKTPRDGVPSNKER